MTSTELVKFKEDALNYFERVKQNGGRILSYNCPCCEAELISNVPTDKKDVWDSMVACYECGERYFYIKKYSKITAKKMQ